MSGKYKSPRHHLDDALALVSQLVERQIIAHWELGILPPIKDEFSGTFVSGGEVEALLRGGNKPTLEGRTRIADLDAAIAAREGRMAKKLTANREAGEAVPIETLTRMFRLSPTEIRVLWILIAVEISARLRQLMRYLVNESTRVHADVGLIELLIYSSPETRDKMVREIAPDSRLFRYRLVEHVGSPRQIADAPYLLKPLRVNRRIIELAHGLDRLDPEVGRSAKLTRHPKSFDNLLIEDEVKQQILSLAKNPHSPVMILQGPEGVGKRSLLHGAANALQLNVIAVDCSALPADPLQLSRLLQAIFREATLYRAIPVFQAIQSLLAHEGEAVIGARVDVLRSHLANFAGPVAATCTEVDAKPIAFTRGTVVIDIATPIEGIREKLWQRALANVPQAVDFRKVAARYPTTGGIILRTAKAAVSLAETREDSTVTDDDIHNGLRATLDSQLSTLGVRLSWSQTWDDLVLPEESIDEVREFISRIRHRRRVYEEWGFARKVAKGLGLSALFHGPPGTGKTMVAGIIANELALDLYQIDLSKIVSKYVGETEKNLAELFDAAESGHAILLFDEADSLFAKRTEVKSSVDRYANLEVNYLLQRMEQFSGITILTTNLDSSIDDAFRRRLSFRITFPMPEAEERIRLWQAMIPKEASIEPNINFDDIGEKYEMTGGYIKNAVLRAAFLAAADNSPITKSHLVRAANLEYAAMGKVIASVANPGLRSL